uniref:L-lactate dehydrogenase n=1 Tax=Spongospora subterranea TaxID=70186 RepID=A0A0H5R7A7_9EUKA|eukprot:CRZ09993.1 hypothetical protein [Spongospora subterranea]
MTIPSSATVAVIGAGSVGASVCASLLQDGCARQILLIDVNDDLCKGQAMDLADGNFVTDSKIRQGTWVEAAASSIIVITAGAKQKPQETRNQLLERNSKIINDICDKLMPISSTTIVLIVSNPVEVMSGIFQHISGLPANRVIGSGTYLDSMRFRDAIAKRVSIAASSVHAYVVGEHGELQVPLISSAMICGVPVLNFPELDDKVLGEIAAETPRRAYDIIALKGSTYYGIAMSVLRMCNSIIGDRHQVFCNSVLSQEFETYLSLPCVIGRMGVVQILPASFSQAEKEGLKIAADAIKQRIDYLKTLFSVITK